ncbi:GGDEF domain-containing protein [Catenovulum adriaticum]|uniref:GGDEF domain-containing protein n=1 Tax=Catenovulum adriaticum TaxID=2984846 RepID=UPI002DD68568|nr:GGDEF domain-containing protein [Catenovulum sp. TS8]
MRRIFILNLFSLVGASVTAIMGGNALIHDNYLLASSLLLACICFYGGHFYLKTTQHHKEPATGVLIALSSLMLYLIYSGGVDNTGPLWIYIIPPVALFLGGLSVGLFNIFVFISLAILLMFYDNGALLATEYSVSFKLRLIYSFLTVTFLSYCYEYSRKLSLNNIKELSEKFEKMAKHDALTGLSNRRDMMDKIQIEYARISRSHNTACLLLCDIDHFKQVNDNYGHEAGDIILTQLSTHFKNMVRQQDVVSRWGGEEFLFLLPDANLNSAEAAAENIREKIADIQFKIGKSSTKITLSIGVSTLSENRSITDSIGKADKFLYKAKQNGRNQVCSSKSVALNKNTTN